MLRIVICDDRPVIAAEVEQMVRKHWPEAQTLCLFSREALERHLGQDAPGRADILLLDIELGDGDGIALSRWVLERWPRMQVIFFTGHAEYCEDIFSSRPTAFLLKPVKAPKLWAALDRAAELLRQQARQLSILDRTGLEVNLPVEEIRYLTNQGRLVRICWTGGVVECRRRLDDLARELPGQFERCHQSYLVNLAQVERMEGSALWMNGVERVPVSRARLQSTREALMRLAAQGL